MTDVTEVTWVRVDGTRALGVPRAWTPEEQCRAAEHAALALEAIAQHGSTSAEESLVGAQLSEVAALRRAGLEVTPLDAFLARLAQPLAHPEA
jgi:hypothetical protein